MNPPRVENNNSQPTNEWPFPSQTSKTRTSQTSTSAQRSVTYTPPHSSNITPGPWGPFPPFPYSPLPPNLQAALPPPSTFTQRPPLEPQRVQRSPIQTPNYDAITQPSTPIILNIDEQNVHETEAQLIARIENEFIEDQVINKDLRSFIDNLKESGFRIKTPENLFKLILLRKPHLQSVVTKILLENEENFRSNTFFSTQHRSLSALVYIFSDDLNVSLGIDQNKDFRLGVHELVTEAVNYFEIHQGIFFGKLLMSPDLIKKLPDLKDFEKRISTIYSIQIKQLQFIKYLLDKKMLPAQFVEQAKILTNYDPMIQSQSAIQPKDVSPNPFLDAMDLSSMEPIRPREAHAPRLFEKGTMNDWKKKWINNKLEELRLEAQKLALEISNDPIKKVDPNAWWANRIEELLGEYKDARKSNQNTGTGHTSNGIQATTKKNNTYKKLLKDKGREIIEKEFNSWGVTVPYARRERIGKQNKSQKINSLGTRTPNLIGKRSHETLTIDDQPEDREKNIYRLNKQPKPNEDETIHPIFRAVMPLDIYESFRFDPLQVEKVVEEYSEWLKEKYSSPKELEHLKEINSSVKEELQRLKRSFEEKLSTLETQAPKDENLPQIQKYRHNRLLYQLTIKLLTEKIKAHDTYKNVQTNSRLNYKNLSFKKSKISGKK